jgi:hypothetical protein
MTNVEPPDEIPPNWRTEFRGRYGQCVEKRIQTFEEEDEGSYRDDLDDGIGEEKRHRELTNLCIFPFVEFQPLDYEFIRADPLEELGVPNFDFLLFDFDGHAIFGEVKASVGEGYASNYVQDVIDQREEVEEHEEYIVENYVGQPIRNPEFVLAVFAKDADAITREVISRRENIVTWRVHQMEKEIRINTTLPEPEDWTEDPDELYQLLKHDHAELNSTLPKYGSSTECFDLFIESHPVTELRTLITARHKERGHSYVNRDALQETIEDSLFYLDEDRRREIEEDIITLAMDINYLREWEKEEGDFKLVSRYTHSDGLEKTLKRKWIDYKVGERKDEIRQECRETITQDILSQAKPQTKLTDF